MKGSSAFQGTLHPLSFYCLSLDLEYLLAWWQSRQLLCYSAVSPLQSPRKAGKSRKRKRKDDAVDFLSGPQHRMYLDNCHQILPSMLPSHLLKHWICCNGTIMFWGIWFPLYFMCWGVTLVMLYKCATSDTNACLY